MSKQADLEQPADVDERRSGAVDAGVPPAGGIVRLLKIGLLIFGLMVGGVAVAAFVAGDQANLPFDYEGFD